MCVCVCVCVCVRVGVCRCVQVCTSEGDGREILIDPLISSPGRGEGARELQSTWEKSVVESNKARQERREKITGEEAIKEWAHEDKGRAKRKTIRGRGGIETDTTREPGRLVGL